MDWKTTLTATAIIVLLAVPPFLLINSAVKMACNPNSHQTPEQTIISTVTSAIMLLTASAILLVIALLITVVIAIIVMASVT